MKKVNFSENSLVLVCTGKVLFQSSLSGLRPLVECVKQYSNYKNCTLYDRVIGLAAARIIVHTGIISRIVTPLASGQAKKLLGQNNIEINAEKTVERILNKDKNGTCPMELKAMKAEGNEEFFLSLLLNDNRSSSC